MNVSELQAGILSGNLTNEDLVALIDTIKFARTRLGNKIKRQLVVGSTVTFTDRGTTYEGVIEKIAVKFATVVTKSFRGRTNAAVRVPASMLLSA